MKITTIQMNSQANKIVNLNAACVLAQKAIEADRPDLIAFPEMMSFYGGSIDDRKNAAEDIPKGETTNRLAELAKKNRIFVHGGSFYEKSGDKVYNTSLAFNRDGEIIAHYRKIHLFDIVTPDGTAYKESDTVLPGDETVTYQADDLIIGCSICYDLRFAELYLDLAKKNADLIMIPAAFTLQTGKDHWAPLIQARAIETQCYIMAPAQWGLYHDGTGHKRQTWGHSMIVDPWGHIITQVSDGTGWASAILNKAYLDTIRTNMPIAQHRRL